MVTVVHSLEYVFQPNREFAQFYFVSQVIITKTLVFIHHHLRGALVFANNLDHHQALIESSANTKLKCKMYSISISIDN